MKRRLGDKQTLHFCKKGTVNIFITGIKVDGEKLYVCNACGIRDKNAQKRASRAAGSLPDG